MRYLIVFLFCIGFAFTVGGGPVPGILVTTLFCLIIIFILACHAIYDFVKWFFSLFKKEIKEEKIAEVKELSPIEIRHTEHEHGYRLICLKCHDLNHYYADFCKSCGQELTLGTRTDFNILNKYHAKMWCDYYGKSFENKVLHEVKNIKQNQMEIVLDK